MNRFFNCETSNRITSVQFFIRIITYNTTINQFTFMHIFTQGTIILTKLSIGLYLLSCIISQQVKCKLTIYFLI